MPKSDALLSGTCYSDAQPGPMIGDPGLLEMSVLASLPSDFLAAGLPRGPQIEKNQARLKNSIRQLLIDFIVKNQSQQPTQKINHTTRQKSITQKTKINHPPRPYTTKNQSPPKARNTKNQSPPKPETQKINHPPRPYTTKNQSPPKPRHHKTSSTRKSPQKQAHQIRQTYI